MMLNLCKFACTFPSIGLTEYRDFMLLSLYPASLTVGLSRR